MNEKSIVTYHEVDFLLPVHRFDVRFSYVTKKGLPFIREFVLRLVHISNMKPSDVASYLGLSKLEVDEAITDLVDRGELEFLENGQITLTSKSKGYFTELGSIPMLSTLLESGGAFSFELASFNCVGRKRTNESPLAGLWLDVPNEVVANSERITKKKFQEQFFKIQEQGFWEHKSTSGNSERPSIYTMETVRKLGQEPKRLTTCFSIDPLGFPVEREDFEGLEDSSAVQSLVTDKLALTRRPMNFKEIANAMVALGDRETKNLFNENSVDIPNLLSAQNSGRLDDGKWVPFIGPIYSKVNWELISSYVKSSLTAIRKSKKAPLDMLWIAPSDGFWGQSLRTVGCFNDLTKWSVTEDKNKLKLYEPQFYLPLSGHEDRRTLSKWRREFENLEKNTYGLLEGFLDGCVEVFLIPGYMAVVCYHVSKPDTLPVTLPIGYISMDRKKVDVVERFVMDYLKGMDSYEKPRDLGPLRQLGKG